MTQIAASRQIHMTHQQGSEKKCLRRQRNRRHGQPRSTFAGRRKEYQSTACIPALNRKMRYSTYHSHERFLITAEIWKDADTPPAAAKSRGFLEADCRQPEAARVTPPADCRLPDVATIFISFHISLVILLYEPLLPADAG